jgi:ATP-dependent RNA helicase DeaD
MDINNSSEGSNDEGTIASTFTSPVPGASQLAELPEATLADLPEKLREGIIQAGWKELMPVQAKAIPYLFSQRDMMIQSRTGSGKTGAYLLPILEMINPLSPKTQALVMVPTRELAHQVIAEAEILGRSTGVNCLAVYGGVGYKEQVDAFHKGAHLVVGTPGRVLDHLLRRTFNLDALKFLVLDEADRMLSMGFYPDMKRVQSYLPQNPICTFMFSATFPLPVLRLTNQFMRDPGFLNLSSDHIHVSETEHIFYTVPGMDKDRTLIRIIEMENPVSALIFCNTKVRVDYVTTVLQRFGYDADELTSDLSQAAREKVLNRVRQNSLRFLVATDIAARGIDLPDLTHVFQFEPPDETEAYIHRAGRTGRAGASGTAITLVNTVEKGEIVKIGKMYSIPFVEKEPPDDKAVQEVVSERVISLLEARLRNRDRLQSERMERFLPLTHEMLESEEQVKLLTMLLDDFYQGNFHPPIPEDADHERPARLQSTGQAHIGRRRPEHSGGGSGFGGGRRGGRR